VPVGGIGGGIWRMGVTEEHGDMLKVGTGLCLLTTAEYS
jgi:hypothetical protein